MQKLDYTEETRRGEAINHHHRKFYEEAGSFYLLDKTMDGAPPFYSFHALDFDPRIGGGFIGPHIQVQGKDYWGDGLSWGEAEELIRPIIEKADGI